MMQLDPKPSGSSKMLPPTSVVAVVVVETFVAGVVVVVETFVIVAIALIVA